EVSAGEDVAAGFEGVGGVECVAWGEAGAGEELAGAVDDGLVGDGEFEVESIEGFPESREPGFHGPGDGGRAAAVGGEGVWGSIIAEPGEDHPVEQFVDDEGADDGGVAGEFGHEAPPPVLHPGIGRTTRRPEMGVEVVGVEVAAGHECPAARSRAGSVVSSQRPPSTASSSPALAGPAAPAVSSQAP